MVALYQRLAIVCPAGVHAGPGSRAEWIANNITGFPGDVDRFFSVRLAETTAGPATYYGVDLVADEPWVEGDNFEQFEINCSDCVYWEIGEGEGQYATFDAAIANLNLVRVVDPV